MIDMEQLADFIKINTPAHFRGICSSLKSLTDELECTKIDLAKMLISAQKQESYSKAHELMYSFVLTRGRIFLLQNIVS